jgi:hypothetical protein
MGSNSDCDACMALVVRTTDLEDESIRPAIVGRVQAESCSLTFRISGDQEITLSHAGCT